MIVFRLRRLRRSLLDWLKCFPRHDWQRVRFPSGVGSYEVCRKCQKSRDGSVRIP